MPLHVSQRRLGAKIFGVIIASIKTVLRKIWLALSKVFIFLGGINQRVLNFTLLKLGLDETPKQTKKSVELACRTWLGDNNRPSHSHLLGDTARRHLPAAARLPPREIELPSGALSCFQANVQVA